MNATRLSCLILVAGLAAGCHAADPMSDRLRPGLDEWDGPAVEPTVDPMTPNGAPISGGSEVESATPAPEPVAPGVAPEQPTEPEPGTGSEQSADPEQPSEPADPEQLSEPEQPSDPEEPSEPAEPEQPADPEQPGQPTEPEQPTTVVLLLAGTAVDGASFDLMGDRLWNDGYEPYVYQPSDGLKTGLANAAEALAEVVEDLMADTGADRIHLVGEGTGGVAVRYFLQVLGGAELTDQVVTLMAPHNGTKLSGAGYWATGWQSFKDVEPNSAFMQELNSAPFPDGLQLTSIYSCWDGYLVPYTTSVVDGATNVEFCAHKVKHFDSFQDTQVYERLRLALADEGAPVDY